MSEQHSQKEPSDKKLYTQILDLAYPKLHNIIGLYKEQSMYWLSGVTFREFMLGVERPVRLLLLKHKYRFPDSEDYKTRLDFVDEDLQALIADNVIEYGDFWWVDFQSRDCLTQLPETEFLNLLHLKQLGCPSEPPYFPTLQNRFAYFSHDDGWALHLWVDSPQLLAKVLARVLTLKYLTFSGRRSFPHPDEAIANDLVARADEGLFFDFRNVDAHATSVPIYRIGAVKNSDCARRLADEYVQKHSITEQLNVTQHRWQHLD
ncbi:MAG: hypothetical protein SFV81_16205 [Pirellulaceae bacterium]|nr:hypothetical protein [Pirellulaceae bacterium]